MMQVRNADETCDATICSHSFRV